MKPGQLVMLVKIPQQAYVECDWLPRNGAVGTVVQTMPRFNSGRISVEFPAYPNKKFGDNFYGCWKENLIPLNNPDADLSQDTQEPTKKPNLVPQSDY